LRLNEFAVPIAVLLLSALALSPSVAYAYDGLWVKYSGNPVLSPTQGSWDAGYTIIPRILYDGHIFRMWYEGGTATATGVGYATSTDGVRWIKHNAPVLSPGPSGAWDSSAITLGSIIWNGTLFLMSYSGSNTTTVDTGAAGLATSKDGISWTKYVSNPVLLTSGLDQQYLASPYVMAQGFQFNMWYTGRNETNPKSNLDSTILYATSLDDVKWIKWPSAVLTPSSDPKAWDSSAVYAPSVIYDGTNFDLWYTGLGQSLVSPQIGFATSPDGAIWTRSPLNPILSPGPPGSWDSASVEQPSVVQVGQNYMLYYDGYSSIAGGRIGLASAPATIVVPEFPDSALDLLLGLSVLGAVCIIRLRKRGPRV
jgi:predicted GH43/DUF377 family glycosyl hydrolase